MTLRGAAPALCALLLAVAGAALPARPMLTDEDVVRMVVSGMPEAEIVRRIEAARVEFDLGDEMVDELALAGVSPALLEAMRRRQAELHADPAATETPPEADATAATGLRIRLNPEWKRTLESPRPELRLREVIAPDAAERLKLRDGTRFTDLAIVLACLTADHVPDHWRSQSPLGRDFVSMPRHRLLAFIPGATPVEAGRSRRGGKAAILRLEIPAAIEAVAKPGVAHDLLLGVAARAGERYLLLARATRSGVVPGDGVTELLAALSGGKSMAPGTFSVRFVEGGPETEPRPDH